MDLDKTLFLGHSHSCNMYWFKRERQERPIAQYSVFNVFIIFVAAGCKSFLCLKCMLLEFKNVFMTKVQLEKCNTRYWLSISSIFLNQVIYVQI
jgi:hypothetical protein